MPYYPNRPIPMCAVFIMGTSLAPSPIANVILFSFYLTKATTYAFCKGNSRQQTTASQYFASYASNVRPLYNANIGVRSEP